MDWLKDNPWFGTGLLLCLALAATEGWLLHMGWMDAVHESEIVGRLSEELDSLLRQSPALNEANEHLIAAELAATQRVVAGLKSKYGRKNGGAEERRLPVDPIEAYLELRNFVEINRAAAIRAGIVLGPDESFGFSSYSHGGPESEFIPAVFRQQVAVDHLLKALWASHPQALLSIRRERPAVTTPDPVGPLMGAGPGKILRDVEEGGQPRDFFVFERVLAVDAARPMMGNAYRLEFTGTTMVLRSFLNRLTAIEQPVVIHRVEVEPRPADAGADEPADAPLEAIPLVHRHLSTFVVVVEFNEFPTAREADRT